MQKKPPSSFCAGAAIAAVLALGSTGALAQDVTALPVVAPPALVAAATVPVMTQSPVVQAVPPAAEPTSGTQPRTRAAAVPRQTAAHTATRAPAVAVPAVAPRVPAPAAVVAPAPVPAVPAPSGPPPAAAIASQPADEGLTDEGLTGAEAGLLALLAVAGVGGAALIAARARRRRPDETEALESSPVANALPAAPAVVAIPPAAAEPERVSASPERFAMPAGPVPTGAERDELLRRMVAAPPDEHNPFVSRRRRVHRARILLAERERELRDRSIEPFDWRTYHPTGMNGSRPAEARPEVAHNPT